MECGVFYKNHPHDPRKTEACTIMRKWYLLVFLVALFLGLSLPPVHGEGAQVSGTVWLDRNRNGKRDTNDKPVSGAKVQLEQKTAGGSTYLATFTTKADGQFAFAISKAGDYRLRIDLPKDHFFTVHGTDSAALPGQRDRSVTPYFTVQNGDAVKKDIGAVTGGCNISIVAFEDTNGNGGRTNSEPFLRGVTAELLYEYDGKTYVVTKTTSDKKGNLSIWDVSPGTYRLRVTLPNNYVIGPRGDKNTSWYNCINADKTPGKGYSNTFTLQVGHSMSMGIGAVKTGSVKGKIWLDANSNGKMDASEKGLSGVSLTVSSVAFQFTRTVQADASGNYSITGLQPGNYKLTVKLPTGYIFTYPGVSAISSISSSGDVAVNVQEQKTATVGDIGAMPAASLKLTLFVDENENGQMDDGEKPLQGASVAVLQNGAQVGSVKSNLRGDAVFSTLRSGKATLTCTLPAGYIFLPREGSLFNGSAVSASGQVNITLQGSETVLSAPVVVPGEIHGKLFEDPENTGIFTEDCDALSGFTVQAVNAKGTVVASATTGQDGGYTLTPLPSGTYTVRFLLDDSYVASPHTPDNHIVSQNPAYGETAPVTLRAGDRLAGMDGAVFQAGIVDGYVRNALKENSGIKNVTVYLLNEQGTPVSDHAYGVTDERGYFLIKGILPGTYSLRYALPDNAAFDSPETDDREVFSDPFTMSSGMEIHVPKLEGVYTASLTGFVGQAGAPSDAVLTLTAQASGQIYESETAEGRYRFSLLRPGTYELRAVLPEDHVFGQLSGSPFGPAAQHTAAVTLSLLPQEEKTVDILSSLPVELTGVLYLDANASGTREAKENGAAQRELTLWMGDEKAADLVTDEQGAFTAHHLVPGAYTLRITLEDNEILTNQDAQHSGSAWSTPVDMQQSADIALPLVQYASVSGAVWSLDGTSKGVKGIAVTLLNRQGEQVGSAKTNAKGAYTFTKLLPGQYTLNATLPKGYLFARKQDTQKRNSFIQSPAKGKAQSIPFAVEMGKAMENVDIGMGAMGRIGDKAWLDENGNGMQDIGEPGLPGIKIEMYQHGELIATVTSDVYGRYDLDQLYPGEYDMKVTMPGEVKPTKVQTRFPLVASILPESTKTTVTAKVIVPSGGENLHCDLGFVLKKKGVYPASMKKIPAKDWTPYENR